MKRRTPDREAHGQVAHVFVCTTRRDSEHACCGAVGGDAVLEAVTDWLRYRDAFWSDVSVSTTSCLGLCSEDGAALTVQPHDEWYSDVRAADVPALLEGTVGTEVGDPVRE
ncbi:ferredoxin [Halomarina halobia]|uniref:Ferredoxin n=1 Tax=Halomarina halobia TaxID=3033386 RepID=A0ABD6A530_9EURY|nr:(2Fe-2S) ferredoxin domain-containing protein [Halomarina sp. PSR21]